MKSLWWCTALFVLWMPIVAQENAAKETFVESLLQQMTLEEKIGQMTQIAISEIIDQASKEGWDQSGFLEIDEALLAGFVRDYHVGSFLNGYAVSSEEWYRFGHRLQQLNVKYSRLNIPILFGIDHIHGATYLKDATIFPQSISLACSFNPELARRMGEITVLESGHLGHHWLFNPVLDLGRNKYWPRFHETYGEDAYLAARMGEAYIAGVQETPVSEGVYVAACAKHFLGYSVPGTGRDRSPAEISWQALHETHRPAFQAAVDAGVQTIMVNSGEINGVPVHASYDILTTMLRKQMGFTGVVVTDWEDIISLRRAHRVAKDDKEAVFMAIMAGIDMSMVPYDTSFCVHLTDLVREGRITEARIDASVRRILELKYDVGLFSHPYPENKNLTAQPSHHAAAREAVEESIVLMKNRNNVLPLADAATIVVAGSTLEMKRALTGGWTYTWGHSDDSAFPETMLTVKEALIHQLGAARVLQGVPGQLKEAALEADAIVIVTGEAFALSEGFNNITDLDLPQQELQLIKEALLTGKPVVLVLTQGRPRTFPSVADGVDAIVFAGLPGYFGAGVIADVLTGKVNPSGKLSFTYPYHQGFQLNYDHKHTSFTYLHQNSAYLERYAIGFFGEGLSYTSFKYEDLTLSRDMITSESQVLTASVRVTNTGRRAGKEAVLWFIQDEYGQITRPVKVLKSFEKRELKPGESRVFKFEIDPVRDLGYPDANGQVIIEDGTFKVMTGGLEQVFEYRNR